MPTMRSMVALVLLALVSAAPTAAQPAGTMTWAVHVTLATRWLDPGETDSEITPFMIFYALHDALVKPMPASLNAPSLAESWGVARDGRVWEFVLRKGVRFRGGRAEADPRVSVLGAARGASIEAVVVERRPPWHARTTS